MESVVFAGLKPSGGDRQETQAPQRGGTLRKRIDILLFGRGTPSDPFYLTNRTWKQKARLALLVGTPVVLVFGVFALAFTNVFAPKAAPLREVTPAEAMAKLLPNLQNTVHIETDPDAEIVEIRVAREGAPRVVGVLRNKSDRVISVTFDVDLADLMGSRVKSFTARVNYVPPHSTAPFDFPADSPAAAQVLPKNLHTLP